MPLSIRTWGRARPAVSFRVGSSPESSPQFIRMLIQYVLDSYITSMLPWSLIVSRQLVQFAPFHSSRRCLCGRRLPRPGRGVSALYSYRSFSPNIGREHPISRKILAANLFRISTHFARFLWRLSPFRINTSKSVSKQRTLTIFRMNTGSVDILGTIAMREIDMEAFLVFYDEAGRTMVGVGI